MFASCFAGLLNLPWPLCVLFVGCQSFAIAFSRVSLVILLLLCYLSSCPGRSCLSNSMAHEFTTRFACDALVLLFFPSTVLILSIQQRGAQKCGMI